MKKNDKRYTEEEFKKYFIENYENNIKFLKDYYYKYQEDSNNDIDATFEIDIKLMAEIFTATIGIILIAGFNLSIIPITAAITIIICSGFGFNDWYKSRNKGPRNLYKKEIRKMGYLSISEYEDDVEDYITGPKGIYSEQLSNLLIKYNINSNTPTILDLNQKKYYVWIPEDDNSNQKTLNLLATDTKEKPIIQNYKFEQIKYYRVDYENKILILKLDRNELVFEESAVVILSQLLKGKEIVNRDNLEDIIKDFEEFMINYKSIYADKSFNKYYNSLEAQKYLPYSVILLIISTILNKFPFGITIIENALNLLASIATFLITFGIYNIFEYKLAMKNADKNIINELSKDKKCNDKFTELKYSLGIKNTYDIIYSDQNIPYYVWVNNGYFHLFLNVIYFNSIYMIININDIVNYETNNKECLVKLSDKTLVFRKDAEEILDKLILAKKKIDNNQK